MEMSEQDEAIERPLCDPKTDVRDSELEWPFWVDLSRSRWSDFGQKRPFTVGSGKDRLRIRKRSFGRCSSVGRS
jgi:hypothetical protein